MSTGDDRKPLYALVGVNAVAYEKLRELPLELGKLQERLSAQGRELPVQVRTLPHQVRRYAEDVGSKATEIYNDLAARGQRIVGDVRRQESTERLQRAARTTVRNVAATRRSARRTVQAAEEVARDAADSAG